MLLLGCAFVLPSGALCSVALLCLCALQIYLFGQQFRVELTGNSSLAAVARSSGAVVRFFFASSMAQLTLEVLKNQEQPFLRREDDDGQPRPHWYMEQCPCHDDGTMGMCSAQSWKKANVWSYASADHVRAYLKHHLMNSSCHGMDEWKAEAASKDFEILEGSETYEEREQYRLQLEQSQRHAAGAAVPPPPAPPPETGHSRRQSSSKGKQASGAAAPRTPTGGPPESSQATTSKLSSAAVALQQRVDKRTADKDLSMLRAEVGELSKSLRGALPALAALPQAGASSSSSVVAAPPPGTVNIQLKDLELVGDCLTRASLACNQCEQLCTKLSKQFEREGAIIDKAKDVVKGLVARAGGTVQLF